MNKLNVLQEWTEYTDLVVCDLCGSLNSKIIYPATFKKEDFLIDKAKSFVYASEDGARGNIVRCQNCGLVYMNPRDKDISKLYEIVGEDNYYISSKNDRIATCEEDLKKIEMLTGPAEKRKLLDIGSSYGFFLDVAKRAGWDVYGSELSKTQFEYCLNYHQNIRNKQLKECDFPSNFFDVITMFDVIEHLPSPKNFLFDVSEVIKDDGMLIICTPNFSSWPAKLSGKYWLNLARMHLYYFDRRSIVKLLENCGYEVISIKKHKRIIKVGKAIEWMKKYPAVYKLMRIVFGSSYISNFKFKTGLSGNIMVFAKKKIL